MYPEFHLLGFSFNSQLTLVILAFLVGTIYAVHRLNSESPPIKASTLMGLFVLGSAFLGAKVYWFIQYDSLTNLLHGTRNSGMVYYGGLIGGIVGLATYLKITKLPFIRVADICCPYAALGEAAGRIGCFLNGCCSGQVSTLPWAVSFPRTGLNFEEQLLSSCVPAMPQHSLPVHPTQLYMAMGLVAIFMLLKWSQRRERFAGHTTLLFFFLHGIVRFTVEFFRIGNRPILSMTVSQMIGLSSITGAIAAYLLVRWYLGHCTAATQQVS